MDGLGQPEVVLKTRKFQSALEIKRAIAKRYGITVADLESQTRMHRIAHPRQIAMALCYRRLRKYGYSLPMIGKLFGGRDHTTVLFACRKYNAMKGRVSPPTPHQRIIPRDAAQFVPPPSSPFPVLLKPISVQAAFSADQFAWRSLPGQLEVAA